MRIAEAVGLCGLSLLLGTGAAGAMTPVSPEQILCSGDHIFVGRVTAVANRDCRLGSDPVGCRQQRRNDVELTIRVTRVMGARTTAPGELRVGQTIAARSFTYSSPHNTKKFTGQGALAFRARPEALLPEGWLQAAYVGQDFLFSGNAARVMVWPADGAAWAADSMIHPEKRYGGDCAVPL
ncbi:hypothetical protein [Reyranella sp.]|uniref:hypothetical protein n=1 Tax=Reyranella sp. TaxID=1929291 RepID=UPI003D0BA42B